MALGQTGNAEHLAQATPARASRALVVSICCAGAFLAFLDTTIVNVAFPSIVRAFHRSSSLGTLSWVVNGYNVVIAALLVPAGRIADRIGRRRSFVAGLLVFAAASAACAFAPTLPFLIAVRCAQAIGAAILIPTSLALLLPRFEMQHRLAAVSLWGAVGALAGTVGPTLGGVLIDAFTWRAVFLVNVPVCLAAAALAIAWLREERVPGALPDMVGTGLLASALTLLALGIVKANEWEWGSVRTVGCFLLAAVLLALVAIRCNRHPEPVIEPSLLRSRSAGLGNVAALLISVALYAGILNHILFLTDVWHWHTLIAGFAISPAALMTAVVARPAGALAQRYGARAIITPGTIIYSAGILLLSWGAGRSPDFLSHWLPGALVTGIGLGMALPPLVGVALAAAPEKRFATASAINAATRQLGGVLGVALLISVVSARGVDTLAAHRAGWYLSVAFALAAGLVTLGLKRQ